LIFPLDAFSNNEQVPINFIVFISPTLPWMNRF
jgi:hypothetical protein